MVASRLLAGKNGRGWQDTRVAIAKAHPALARVRQWTNWMTGEHLPDEAAPTLDALLGDVSPGSARLPFAVLVPTDALA